MILGLMFIQMGCGKGEGGGGIESQNAYRNSAINTSLKKSM